MGGRSIWIADRESQGWACSQCKWVCPMPSLLSGKEGKSAFDRLASAKFAEHDCTRYAPRFGQSEQHSFSQKGAEFGYAGIQTEGCGRPDAPGNDA
jgi:hypothetical protein